MGTRSEEPLDEERGRIAHLQTIAPWLHLGAWNRPAAEPWHWATTGTDATTVVILRSNDRSTLQRAARSYNEPVLVLGWYPSESHAKLVLRDEGTTAWLRTDQPTKLFESSVSPADTFVRARALADTRPISERFYRDMDHCRHALSTAWSHLTEPDDAPALTLLLITRLLFLHYLEERQWFSESRDFLARLLLHPDAHDLYSTRIRPLFLDALNQPISSRRSGPLFASLPFLNGGLFAESPEELRNPNAQLDDAPLRSLMRNVFARYLFSLDPRTAHIDPVMLGTLFERWMGHGSRRRTGAYYTPPDLVRSLTEPVLHALLERRLGPPIANYLRTGDPELTPSPTDAATALHTFDSLRVLDPAVGTGAFLVNVVRQLARARLLLARAATPNATQPRSLADELRFVLQTLVCGVDLSRTAVHLCTLRVWLEYVAALPPAARPSLPNLHHRLRHGDSLASAVSLSAFDATPLPTHLIDQYNEVCADFSRSCGRRKLHAERTMLQLEATIGEELARARIQRIDQSIRDTEAGTVRQSSLLPHPTPSPPHDVLRLRNLRNRYLERVHHAQREGWATLFDPHIHFAPIMQQGGFDLVLGNPPWVRLAALDPDQRAYLTRTYRWMRNPNPRTFGTQADLSVAFFERSVSLTRPDGFVALLVPSKLLNATYGETLRACLLRDTFPEEVVDLRDNRSGFRASVYPTFLVARRRRAHLEGVTGYAEVRRVTIDPHGRHDNHIAFTLPRDLLSATSDPRDPWPLLDPTPSRILRSLLSLPPISEHYAPRIGLKTGNNSIYCEVDPQHPGVVPFLRGADIHPMHATPRGTLLLPYDPHTETPWAQLPAELTDWLELHSDALLQRSDYRSASMRPWELFRVSDGSFGHRVVWRDLAPLLHACPVPPINQGGPAHINSCYAFHVDTRDEALTLSLWLNSLPARFVAWALAEPAANGYRRYMAANVGRVPLPPDLRNPQSHLFLSLLDLAHSLLTTPTTPSLWNLVDHLAFDALQIPPSHARHLAQLLATPSS